MPHQSEMNRITKTFDSQIVNSWINDVEKWSNMDARKKAYDAIENINNGSNIMAAIDSNNHLIAITTYMTITSRLRLSMMHDVDETSRPIKLVNAIDKNGLIFVYILAGAGQGGAKQIIDELKTESLAKNRPIFLNSTDIARSFYVKMGLEQVADSNHYYWLDTQQKTGI